jgi:hypothetical protein
MISALEQRQPNAHEDARPDQPVFAISQCTAWVRHGDFLQSVSTRRRLFFFVPHETKQVNQWFEW